MHSPDLNAFCFRMLFRYVNSKNAINKTMQIMKNMKYAMYVLLVVALNTASRVGWIDMLRLERVFKPEGAPTPQNPNIGMHMFSKRCVHAQVAIVACAIMQTCLHASFHARVRMTTCACNDHWSQSMPSHACIIVMFMFMQTFLVEDIGMHALA